MRSRQSKRGSGLPAAAGTAERPSAPALPVQRDLAVRSPQGLLALQRAAGNAAVAGLASRGARSAGTRAPAAAPVIQRVKTGAPTGVVSGDDEAFFTTQAPEGVLRDGRRQPDGLLDHHVDHVDAQDHHPGDVSLRYSDDDTLAVHDTEREPKEFYATDEVFQHAVDRLAQVGSAYTLVRGGSQIKTAAGTLGKITPVTADEATRKKAGRFADLMLTECIEVARKVVGSRKMQVVMAGDGGAAPWRGKSGVDLAHHLDKTARSGGTTNPAEAAAGASAAGAAAEANGTEIHNEREVARDYGTTLRERPAEADRVAQEMGVNQYARPLVGEGFATHSVGDEDKHDFATVPDGESFTDRSADDIWNYHFAGVVARSKDEKSWVTLENYKRDYNAKAAVGALEKKLLKAYKEKTKALLNGYQGKTPQGVFDSDKVMAMIQELAGVTRQDAMQEYQKLGTDKLAWQGKWFFRLYGSQPGETFHDKQYGGGANDIVNPLTVRVRRG
ncbi:DUF4157 domain-containing protein [Streptomyces sp. NPDC059398]|uniref:DUF4157 domain-containing protein n=1 Tax=Streptomyces sp. NPDC059398 TaxID=3346820 RepID=UPI00369F5C10